MVYNGKALHVLPDQWVSYEKAQDRSEIEAAGLCLMPMDGPPDAQLSDPRCGLHIVDLDRFIDTGERVLRDMERARPLIESLKEFGMPVEKSVSGQSLHYLFRTSFDCPYRVTGKRHGTAKEISVEVYGFGGSALQVAITMDWLHEGNRTIPCLTDLQAAKLLKLLGVDTRRQQSKTVGSNPAKRDDIGEKGLGPYAEKVDKEPAALWRHRLAIKQLEGLTMPREGERHDMLISRAGKYARLGVSRELFYTSQVLPLVGTGIPGNEFDEYEAQNVIDAYDKWFIAPAQNDSILERGFPKEYPAFRDGFREPVYNMLAKVAREKSLITYKELALAVRMASNPVSTLLGFLLSEINIALAREALPMLSSVVVRKEDMRPGDGYYGNACYLLRLQWSATEAEKAEFWDRERKHVYEARAEYGETEAGELAGSPIDIPRDKSADCFLHQATESDSLPQLPIEQALRKVLQGKGPHAVGESGQSNKLLEMPSEQYAELMAKFNSEQKAAIHRMEGEVGMRLQAGETNLVIPARETLTERDQEIISALYVSFNRFRTGGEDSFLPRTPEDLAQEFSGKMSEDELQRFSSQTLEINEEDEFRQQTEARDYLEWELQQQGRTIESLEKAIQTERDARGRLERKLRTAIETLDHHDLRSSAETRARNNLERNFRRETRVIEHLESKSRTETEARKRLEREIWGEIAARKRLGRVVLGVFLVTIVVVLIFMVEPAVVARIREAILSLIP